MFKFLIVYKKKRCSLKGTVIHKTFDNEKYLSNEINSCLMKKLLLNKKIVFKQIVVNKCTLEIVVIIYIAVNIYIRIVFSGFSTKKLT